MGGRALRLLLQGCSPRKPSGALCTSTAFRCFGSALSPAHLPPASCCLCLPSATCAQRSPDLHPAPSQPLPQRGGDLVHGHAVPRFLPVLGRSSRAQKDSAHPGRQAPLNAGAISMSPHGDTAGNDGRAGARWADTKQVAALEGGHHITTSAQKTQTPETSSQPGLLAAFGKGFSLDREREGKWGRPPPALL